MAQQPPFGLKQAMERARLLTPRELDVRLACHEAAVIFVDTSKEFADAHVPGARWVSRSWLDLTIAEVAPDKVKPVVVTDCDGRSAILAAATLRDLGYQDVSVLAGGLAAWREAGLPLEHGLAGVMSPPEDFVPAGPERPYHDMINYLRWEESLGHKYEVQRR